MRIQSIIERPGGTTIEMGSKTYIFAPDEHDSRHIAVVHDQAHIASFLAIREGFRSLDVASAVLASGLDLPDGYFFLIRGPQDLKAFADWATSIPDMKDEPAEYTLLTDKIALGEASLGGFPLIAASDFDLAFSPATASPPLVPEPSPPAPADNTILPIPIQPEGGAESGDTPAGDGGAGAAGGVGADTSEDSDPPPPPLPAGEAPLDREALAMEYDDLFGHRPNGKWPANKIKAAIDEKKAQG